MWCSDPLILIKLQSASKFAGLITGLCGDIICEIKSQLAMMYNYEGAVNLAKIFDILSNNGHIKIFANKNCGKDIMLINNYVGGKRYISISVYRHETYNIRIHSSRHGNVVKYWKYDKTHTGLMIYEAMTLGLRAGQI